MNTKNTHILNASSNLLGFCFFVLVSLKTFGSTTTIHAVDEIVALSILVFTGSCFLSFLSIREVTKKSQLLELYAEYLFLFGLVLLIIVSAFLVVANI